MGLSGKRETFWLVGMCMGRVWFMKKDGIFRMNEVWAELPLVPFPLFSNSSPLFL